MVLSNRSARNRGLAIATVTAVIASVAVSLMSAPAAFAGGGEDNTPHKAYVCKYVGTPGTNERLQTGQNPIDVDFHAIGESPVVVGSYFNDAQGRSYVIALDTGQPEPSASSCPSPAPNHVTPVTPTVTPGTCKAMGTVVATNTAQYTWATSGTTAATIETASAVGNVVLTKTIFGPYDLSKLSGDTCNTPPPPPVCANNGSSITQSGRAANLSSTTVTLKAGFSSCDVSLNNYHASGPTWPTGNPQTFGDHATVHLTTASPTGHLAVTQGDCYNQNDLYIGTTRFDGTDGALPNYPNSVTPTNLVDHWNGGKACVTPPPTSVTPTLTYTPGTCSAVGTVVATNTSQYTWKASGPANATIETATAVGNVVLTKTIFGPYDLSKLSGEACPTPPPAPIACVVDTSIAWSAESGDVAPVLGPNGLVFKGASAPAIDWYERVTTGNAQGITHLAVTYATGGTGQPAQVVIEVLAPYFVTTHDPSGYATLSTNLVAPNGTIDLLASGIGWSSTHISSGPGSLGSPESYSDLVNQIGANTLFSAPSLHLLTNSKGGDSSTVTALDSSCGDTNFVPTKPADVVSHTSKTTVSCASLTQTTITTTTSEPYIWNASSKSYVLDTASADWTVTDNSPGVTVALTSDQIATNCQTEVTPVNPSATDTVCKTGTVTSGTYTVPSTTGVTYLKDGIAIAAGAYTAKPGETVTLTAQPADDTFKLAADSASWTWSKTFATVACLTSNTLAFTGSDPSGWLAFAILALIAGAVAVITARYRRRPRGAHV